MESRVLTVERVMRRVHVKLLQKSTSQRHTMKRSYSYNTGLFVARINMFRVRKNLLFFCLSFWRPRPTV